jgi:hypothetical protein
MSDRIITITLGDATTGVLTMSDQGTTNADRGDQVTWVIGPGSGVASITGIIEKANSADVFNPDPKQLANSTSWQGTVNPNVPIGTVEFYTIQWTTAGSGWLNSGGGASKSYDPKIQIKA